MLNNSTMAEYDNYLVFSIFVLFSGFMIFIFNIINRLHETIEFMHKLYVIFLFISIIISVSGIFLIFSWHLKSSNPFLEDNKSKVANTHFPPYLATGIILTMIGLSIRYSINNESDFIRNFSLITNIVGLFMLTNGFRYFWNEVLIRNFRQKKNKRSQA